MKKTILFLISLVISANLLFSGELQKKFIRGNIRDKIDVVTQCSESSAAITPEENLTISNAAIYYILENKSVLGNDKELEELAVAAINSLPKDYGRNLNETEKNTAVSIIMTVYKEYEDSPAVEIAVLNKIEQLAKYLPLQKFSDTLNNYLVVTDLNDENPEKVNAVIKCLGTNGNSTSFNLLYNFFYRVTYPKYQTQIENSLVTLVPNSINPIIQIINENDFKELDRIYYLAKKNSKISTSFMSEIAENVLKKTILNIGNSSDKNKNDEIVAVQLDSLKVLNDNKWTRASGTVISFFNAAKLEYKNGIINEEQFAVIIDSVGNIAPIDSVLPLVNYLGELNDNTQNNIPVSTTVILAVINTLGAIGNKSAFDSLLSVTYLGYPEIILSAARKALAGLKW